MHTTLHSMTVDELDQVAAEAAREAGYLWGVVESGPYPLAVAKASALGRLANEARRTAHNRRYKAGHPCPLECFCEVIARRKQAKEAQERLTNDGSVQ